MKTDEEKTKAYLRDMGIPFVGNTDGAGVTRLQVINHNDHPKISGYSNFLVEWKFNKGSLEYVGAWE